MSIFLPGKIRRFFDKNEIFSSGSSGDDFQKLTNPKRALKRKNETFIYLDLTGHTIIVDEEHCGPLASGILTCAFSNSKKKFNFFSFQMQQQFVTFYITFFFFP